MHRWLAVMFPKRPAHGKNSFGRFPQEMAA
jgi:hypothetical protein